MKKQIKILMLVIALIMACTLTVNAADATVILNPSKQQLVPGEEFTVTISGACEDGINGVMGTITYDKDKLQLVEAKVTDDNWYDNSGEPDDEKIVMEISCNSRDKITTADIFKLTFKVKENAEIGTTAKVTASDIKLDSDLGQNSLNEIGTKEVEVSIVEKQSEQDPKPENPQEKTLTGIEVTKTPTRTTYRAGEKFDKTGMKVIAKYTDGSSKEITNYTIENGDKLVKGQTSVKISYTEGNVTKTVEQKITLLENPTNSDNQNGDGKKDNTQTGKEMPKTGLTSIMGAIVVIGLVGTVCYIKYNKYKKI